MKAEMQKILARRPMVYRRVLELLGRGSLEKRIYLSVLRAGDVIFDVGANRGYFTRLFSDVAGAGGAVHAFEPVPSTFAMLEGAVGGRANVTLNECALSDAEGRATFHLPGGDDGQASMRRHHSGSWATQGGSSAGDAAATRTYECAIRRLDDYAAGMGRLDFVKCDVEGAELAVIQGGAKTLERLFPMLFLETNPAWTKSFGYSPGDLVSAVRGLGYDTILIAEERLVPFAGAEIMGSVNLLCANSKIHAERLRFLDGL